MTITPDTKDWTWVLERPCPECGYTAASIAPAAVASALRGNGAAWADLLARRDDVAVRPDPQTWSPLEYACHVRDVCNLYSYRLGLMLAEDGPTFPDWNQDATAIADRYSEQDPAVVSAELVAAADAFADELDAVTGEQWQRPGTRSDGAHFTIDTFARYFLHDVVHHLADVTGTRAS
ncbi:hypothetical protein F4553_000534 [Allocatelliglobosispora scoriae]|uniref:DinB-like domain-containing protein n=1 Tax=Allocatelliglobosispora scoriae TaxID=643052 RepID=A0A841BHQ6_9ACTN|nr:DinB family protein [Allocatelliglobosispora scoriae]MBB5867155.1 hypothetical protein [Allocatelliglobosispora scoriae]